MNRTYVSLGKPLIFKKFKEFNAPLGWKRIDLLHEKLRGDANFRNKFTKEEITKINKVKL
jgi:hypothetical protein